MSSRSFLVAVLLGNVALTLAGAGLTGAQSGVTVYTTDVTWRAADSPHVITTSVLVTADAHLTIEPGATVRFGEGVYLQIGDPAAVPSQSWASATIGGDAANPVVLEGLDGAAWAGVIGDGTAGGRVEVDAKGVEVRDVAGHAFDFRSTFNYSPTATSEIIDVTIDAPGAAGVRLADASPWIDHLTVTGGTHGVLATSHASRPTIRDSTFTGQSVRHAVVGLGAELAGNAFSGTGSYVTLLGASAYSASSLRIYDEPVVYELDGWAGVTAEGRLTIEAGVEIHAKNGAGFRVGDPAAVPSQSWAYATIGTDSARPVVLKGVSGASWSGILADGTAGGRVDVDLTGVEIHDVAEHGLDLRSVFHDSDTETSSLVDVTVHDPPVSGVRLAASSPWIDGLTVDGGDYGVLATSHESVPMIRGSTFTDQSVRHARVGLGSRFDGNEVSGSGAFVTLVAPSAFVGRDVTIPDEPLTFELEGWAGFENERRLTIEPGVDVVAKPGAYFQIGNAAAAPSQIYGYATIGGESAETTIIASDGDQGWGGLRFDGAGAQGTVTRVNVSGAAEDAVNVTGANGQITLDRVDAWRPGRTGFVLDAAYGVTIRGSTVKGAPTGIHVYRGSHGNTITDNLFANDVNARETSGPNTWSSAPAGGTNVCGGAWKGGNSWSDYAGVDDDGDGLGDTLVPYATGLVSTGDANPLTCDDAVPPCTEGAGTAVAAGARTQSETWTESGSPYTIASSVTFLDGATLTIEACARVVLSEGATLFVGGESASGVSYGQLVVTGTEEKPVTIEGGEVRVRGPNGNYRSTATVRNATFEGADGNALSVEEFATVTIEDSTFAAPRAAGVTMGTDEYSSLTILRSAFTGGEHGVRSLTANDRPTIRGSSFEDQTVRHAVVGFGSVLDGITATGTGSYVRLLAIDGFTSLERRVYEEPVVYELVGWQGATGSGNIVIEPGVHLVGRSGSSLQIGDGADYDPTLTARGTEGRPIVLEAFPGESWGGVDAHFRTSTGNTYHANVYVANVTMRGTDGPAIDAWNLSDDSRFDDLTVEGVTGLALTHSSPTIAGSTFTGGEHGVRVTTRDSLPRIHGSAFTDQTVRYAVVAFGSELRDNTFTGTGGYVRLLALDGYSHAERRVYEEPVTYELFGWQGATSSGNIVIEPGVHMLGRSGSSLRIGDGADYDPALTARGTGDRRIVLEAFPGESWGGVDAHFLTSPGNTYRARLYVANVTMRGTDGPAIDAWNLSEDSSVVDSTFEGVTGIQLAQSSPLVRGSSFTGGEYGVRVTTRDSLPRILSSAFTDQTVRYAVVAFGSELRDNTFTGTGGYVRLLALDGYSSQGRTVYDEPVDYELSGWQGAESSGEIVIEPGVSIHARAGAGLRIGNGPDYYPSLHVRGTTERPVTLAAWDGEAWDGISAPFVRTDGNTYTPRVTIRNATLAGVAGHALRIHNATEVTIDGLTIDGAPGDGIRFLTVTGATVKRSNVSDALGAGIRLAAGSTGNRIFDNRFANAVDAIAEGGNAWHVSPRDGPNVCGDPQIGGNEWGGHTSPDANGDGFRDAAYATGLGGSDADAYPLACGDAPPLLDLVLDAIALTPPDAGAGDAVTVTATIRNAGDAAVGAFTVEFASDDVATERVDGLDAGESIDVVSDGWTLGAGAYSIAVTADSEEEIDEEDESNNADLLEGIAEEDLPTGCASAGPDAGGYSCALGTFAWTDLSGTGALVDFPCESLDDCVSDAIALGFDFEFYGATFSEVNVTTNGLVAFGSDANLAEWEPTALPTASTPNRIVAGFWADLDLTEAGAVRTKTITDSSGSRFVAAWIDAPYRDAPEETVTFEVVLKDDGSIETHVLDAPSAGERHATGIENGDGSAGLTHFEGVASLAEIAIVFTPGEPPAPPEPDLRFDAASISPAEPLAGDEVTFAATVHNAGGAAAGASRFELKIDGVVVATRDVPELAAGSTHEVESFVWTATEGTHGVVFLADAGDAVAESEESNNDVTTSLTVGAAPEPLPDWIVSYLSLPAVIEAGETIEVWARVKNDGDAAAPATVARVAIDGSTIATLTVPALDAGSESDTLVAEWAAVEGERTVKVTVDPDGETTEGDETNNANEAAFTVGPASVPLPDLRVESLTRPYQISAGDAVLFDARVKNVGDATAPATTVRFAMDGETLDTREVPELAAGEEHTIADVAWTAAQGQHSLVVTADAGGSVEEEDEANNALTATLSVLGDPTAFFSIGAKRLAPGASSTLPIRLESVESFGTATVDLVFDPDVVDVTGVSAGDVPGGSLTFSIDEEAGVVHVLVDTTQAPSGDFDLATIAFAAVGANGDHSPLDLHLVEIADDDGVAISAGVTDGRVDLGVKGDANGDGEVTGVDALFIRQYVVGLRAAADLQLDLCDVNGDGEVTGVDALFVRQYVVGLRAEL